MSQFRPTSCVCKLCVCRFANFVAYSLAKFVRGVEDEIVWFEEHPPPPQNIRSIVFWFVLIE